MEELKIESKSREKKRERKLNRERQTVVACWAFAVISTELIPLAQ